MNLLDLAQNCVRANASLVQITVSEDPALELAVITIADDGHGMTPEQLERVTDPFFTTRTTRRVGLGVPLFKMSAELSGGGLEISSTPGKGTRVQASFGLRHIDRMPMGDIASTYCALLQGSPDIEFVYTHTHGSKSFCVDTRQLREVLDGVALNEPPVLEFITQMINEGLAEIGSEL